jgi:hypothetical protein
MVNSLMIFCYAAVGFPRWLGGGDATASVAIVLAVFLLISGSAIACWIVSWRKRGERAAAAANAGMHPNTFQSD